MIITNNTPVSKSAATTSVRNARSTGTESDFMSTVEKMLTDQPAAAESTEENNYYERDGVRWTDERYARFLGVDSPVPIDTTKTINWASEGGKELTEEQIALLKERYDVRYLSPQQFYNLMSDLTHMEVLSGEDCIAPHLTKNDWGDQKFILSPIGVNMSGSNAGPEWDMIGYFINALDKLLAKQEFFNSDLFDQMNSHFTPWDKQQASQAVQKDIEEIEKVLSVLRLLE